MDSALEVELNEAQASAIARIMLAVARSDGEIDPRELSLIEEFSAADPEGADPEPGEVAALFPDAAQKELVVRSALLVALVDRGFSEHEKETINKYALAVGIGEEELERLTSEVKAFLLSPLIRLSNTDSVVEISKNLS